MITSIHGDVLDIALNRTVIECNGVGYLVHATPATLSTLTEGARAQLFSVLVTRKESMTLFGFADQGSCELFSAMLTVSGLGPKTAMAALAVYDVSDLRRIIAETDLKALTRIPGIGPRSAERILLELRNKIPAPTVATPTAVPIESSGPQPLRSEVLGALITLGFDRKRSGQVIDTVLATIPEVSASEALRTALTHLSAR